MPVMRSRKRRVLSHKRGKKSKQTHRRRRVRGGDGKVTRSRKFKKLTCSPLSTEYKNGNPVSAHDTCLPDKDIVAAKINWNKSHPSNPIVAKRPHKIWEEIQNRMKDECSDDLCIVNKPFMQNLPNAGEHVDVNVNGADHSSDSGGSNRQSNIKLKDYYSPIMPKEWKKNPTEWLSNIEILEKMKQYEEAYKCFEFIGPTTIDFDAVLSNNQCVDNDLCKFQLENYIKAGKKKIGIIFNTDPHDKGGSHWISLFINIPKKMIFFFDSAGDKAPEEIMKFVERVKAQGAALTTPIVFSFDQNYPNEHQYSTTECGMYSLYFIINMLEDKLTTKYLKTHIIPDQKMIKYRQRYFNNI